MSDDGYMRRGKSQVLFNYLPGNTFDYTGGSGIHKVAGIDGIERSDLDVRYLGQQVLNKVHAWQNGSGYGAVGFPQYPDSFQLVGPREVDTELFPLLFRCTTCERIHTFDDTNEVSQYNRRLECKHDDCSGELQQHQFVFVHQCGEIRSPDPGRCNGCGSFDGWRFESYGSQRFRNAEWRCQCGNSKDIESWCNCDIPNSRMQLTVHRASSAYQPRHLTVIDIGSGSSADASDPRFAKAVVARYLDISTDPIEDIELDARQINEEREELEWQLEQYEQMYERSGAKEIESEIEQLESQLKEMDDESDPIGEQVVEMVPFLDVDQRVPDERQQAIYDVFQYLNSGLELDRRTARDVILEAGSDDPQSRQRRSLRADRVENQLSALGLTEAAFIEDFPITNVVYGYTRIDREPDDSRLVAFAESEVDSSGDGTPLFADTVETEAVQFGLDPLRVMRWLLSNSRLDDDLAAKLRADILNSTLPGERSIPTLNDWDAGAVDRWLGTGDLEPSDTKPLSAWSVRNVRAWLMTNVGEIPDFETIPIEMEDGEDRASAITYFVYHLVHSYAHLLLKHATQLSGMSRTSMAEFLLPRSLSFVLYSNQRTDFNIGGLYTLIEASLRELLDEVERRGNDCVYDPVCSRDGSACHNCMYLSEVSCTHLNRNLGRDFVYGSKTVADRNLNGYLNLSEDDVRGE